MNIIKKMLVHREKNLVNNQNMILMNIGVQCMFYKPNIHYKLFVVIQLNVVDHGDQIILKYFHIDFYHHLYHLNVHHMELEWLIKIIKKDNFMVHYFNVFNFMGLLFNIHKSILKNSFKKNDFFFFVLFLG